MKKILGSIIIIALVACLAVTLVACDKLGGGSSSLDQYDASQAAAKLDELRASDGIAIAYNVLSEGETTTVSYAAKGDKYYFNANGTEIYFDLSVGDTADMYTKDGNSWVKTSLPKASIESSLNNYFKSLTVYLSAYSTYKDVKAKKSSGKVAGRDCDIFTFDYTLQGIDAKCEVAIDKATGICLKASATANGKTDKIECTKFATNPTITLPEATTGGNDGGPAPAATTYKIIDDYPLIATTAFDAVFSDDFSVTFNYGEETNVSAQRDGDVFYWDETYYDLTEDDYYVMYYEIGNKWKAEKCYYGDDGEPENKAEVMANLKETALYYTKFLLSASDANLAMTAKTRTTFLDRPADKYEKDGRIIIVDAETGLCVKDNKQDANFEVTSFALTAEIVLPTEVEIYDPHTTILYDYPNIVTGSNFDLVFNGSFTIEYLTHVDNNGVVTEQEWSFKRLNDVLYLNDDGEETYYDVSQTDSYVVYTNAGLGWTRATVEYAGSTYTDKAALLNGLKNNYFSWFALTENEATLSGMTKSQTTVIYHGRDAYRYEIAVNGAQKVFFIDEATGLCIGRQETIDAENKEGEAGVTAFALTADIEIPQLVAIATDHPILATSDGIYQEFRNNGISISVTRTMTGEESHQTIAVYNNYILTDYGETWIYVINDENYDEYRYDPDGEKWYGQKNISYDENDEDCLPSFEVTQVLVNQALLYDLSTDDMVALYEKSEGIYGAWDVDIYTRSVGGNSITIKVDKETHLVVYYAKVGSDNSDVYECTTITIPYDNIEVPTSYEPMPTSDEPI